MASGGYFRPRPLSEQGRLDRLILALEVPECDCKIKVKWVKVPLGTRQTPGGRPAKAFERLPRFGWQAKGAKSAVFGSPCPHARKADHALPPERWRKFLELAALERGDEDGYAEPPLDPVPWRPGSLAEAGEALYREGRVGLLAERAALRLALFHPGDWHRGSVEGVGVAAAKGRGQGPLVYEQHCEDDEDAEAVLEQLADLAAWRAGRKRKRGAK